MTETVESALGVSQVKQPDRAGFVAAGAMLKKAREEAGLNIGALAVSLKVPVNKLEALEAGNLEERSGLVFVRALASSVCRTLKVDSTEILAQLPQAVTAQLHQKGDLNEPFRGEGRGVSFSAKEKLLKPSVLAVAALLIGAALLMFLPNLHLPKSFGSKEVPGEMMPPPSAVIQPDVSESAPASISNGRNNSATTASTVPSEMAPVQASPSITAPVSELSASSQVIGPASGVPVAASDGGTMVLRFKASAPSWVEVTDGQGVVVFRKMLASGEVAQVGGTLPLKTVVGRADVTEVSVRGVVVDLKSISKENVARFEVK